MKKFSVICIMLMILVLLIPVLSVSETEELLSIRLPEKNMVCDTDGKIQFMLTLSNNSNSDMNDLSLVLESLENVDDPESTAGEIAAISVNGVPEEEPSDYIWIDCFQANTEMTVDVQFDFAGNENDTVWIRASLCDEEYCEIAVGESRCTRPGNDTQGNEMSIAGVPVLRILLVLIALNAILWTGVILTNKIKKKRE